MRPFAYLPLSLILIFNFPQLANCQSDSIQARIELKASVDRSEVPLNEKLTFTIQASWEGEQNRFSITPVVPPQCENLEMFGSSSLNESIIEAGKTKSLKTFKFTLKPVQTGAGKIGPVQVNYIDNLSQDSSSLSTQPVNVQITPAREKTKSSYKIVLAVAIVLILIYVIFSARRKTKRIEIPEEKETEKLKIEESLEEKTLKKLGAISEQIQRGELRSFPMDVYKLLTGYLESKYQIITSGKTTNDIIISLSNLDLSEGKIAVLKEIFTACDLIKYAGEKIETEKCEEIAHQAKKFLEQNR